MTVLGVVEAEELLAPTNPSAGLERGVHPHDPAADLRRHVDLRARPHRAGPVDGDGSDGGRRGLGNGKGNTRGRLPSGPLGP